MSLEKSFCRSFFFSLEIAQNGFTDDRNICKLDDQNHLMASYKFTRAIKCTMQLLFYTSSKSRPAHHKGDVFKGVEEFTNTSNLL